MTCLMSHLSRWSLHPAEREGRANTQCTNHPGWITMTQCQLPPPPYLRSLTWEPNPGGEARPVGTEAEVVYSRAGPTQYPGRRAGTC